MELCDITAEVVDEGLRTFDRPAVWNTAKSRSDDIETNS